MKSAWKSSALIYIAIMVAGALILYNLLVAQDKPHTITLSQAIEISEMGNIERLVVKPDDGVMEITASVKGSPLLIRDVDGNQFEVTDGTKLIADIANLNLAELKELGLVLPADYATRINTGFDWGQIFLNLLLPILIIGGLLVFLFRSARGANSQALSFARSRARLFPANTPTVTFDDVAGVEEAKEELQEVVEFLKDREKFQTLGARIPRGVLLVGPPGTGKTLLARAVAGQAGVPFFSISGSEFVEMFVGVGASRVRDLFDQAKRNRPCIVFIDEIDAVGRQRGSGLGGSHDEREQTLNQILTEMDGFDTNTGVIVLAATNRPDILDPALLRPGRFDRRVILDRPDINGRKAILKVHSKGKPLAENVDLEVLAKQTVGFSGADLANLINEAAILAARRNKKAVEMAEMNESIDRVIAGPERKSRKVSSKEKEIVAYHEAGHALVARMLPNADPVHKVSIVARGLMGGYTRLLPTEDRYLMTRSQFDDSLATLLAGHVAEEIIFNEASTGPHDDIQRATSLARKMVTDYGMSKELGPRTFGHKEDMVFLGREISEQRDYSEQVAQQIDEEVRKIINSAYDVAKKVLTDNKARLVHLGKKLVVEESLEGPDLETAFNEPIEEPKPDEQPAASPTSASITPLS
ncbi:MAG: ATP-dependent metallopeptidase FtsH/Yme1/Tma family protein [Dehalococcoidia bacterium]|nr:MAG: ATP-dependent metallopeptidase FtsH/Yme1/Tma family protein [Dehalococcoidia bacterium]